MDAFAAHARDEELAHNRLLSAQETHQGIQHVVFFRFWLVILGLVVIRIVARRALGGRKRGWFVFFGKRFALQRRVRFGGIGACAFGFQLRREAVNLVGFLVEFRAKFQYFGVRAGRLRGHRSRGGLFV